MVAFTHNKLKKNSILYLAIKYTFMQLCEELILNNYCNQQFILLLSSEQWILSVNAHSIMSFSIIARVTTTSRGTRWGEIISVSDLYEI